MLRRVTFTRAMHTLLIAVALLVSSNPLRAQCVLSAESIGTGAMVLFQSGDVSQLGDRAGYRVIIPPCGIVNQQHVIKTCLLYTSDAADDLTRVDLGGRRIIK